MKNAVPITVAGAAKLEEELKELKTVKRPAVIAAIAEARAHGDLKENAEYHAAREDQGFIEGRIAEIEGKLANCHVIDVTQFSNDGKVIFGSTVKLLNVDSNEEVTYQIVGIDEANLKENKVSVSSPLSRALIGKFVNDEVDVDTPNGNSTYEILDVDYQ